MRILLDHCVDRRLRREFEGHEVKTTYEMGWAALKNGKLLNNAARAFEVFVTTDQNLKHQQNVSGLHLIVVVLVASTNRLADLRPLIPKLLRLLPSLEQGQLVEIM